MEKEVKNAEMLLQQVSALNKKHKEIARITGEKFNIFSILGVESRETSTHSAFLVALLDPKGSHGQGKVFLDLFVKMLEEKQAECPNLKIPTIDTENSAVEKEKYLGAINETYTEGGRADIVISGVNGSICIENKIYAEDQENQLIRYCNAVGENGLILYLTLTGCEATEWSTEAESKKLALGVDYFTISYKEDILEWLEECQKSVIQVPTVREAIGQYIHLINKLTLQDMSQQQKSDFIELVTKPEYRDAAWEIAENAELIKAAFFRELLEKLKTDDDLKDTFQSDFDSNFGLQKWCGIRFSKPSWINLIEFSFENNVCTEFGVGVQPMNKKENCSNDSPELTDALKAIKIGKEYSHANWIWATDLSFEWSKVRGAKVPTAGLTLIKKTVLRLSEVIDQFEDDAKK